MTAQYGAYTDRPLWLGADGLDDRAFAPIDVLARAHEDGLSRSRYPLAELSAALQRVHGGEPRAGKVADADLLLTAAYAAYADDMLTGQLDPERVSRSWHVVPSEPDVDRYIARLLRTEPFDRALARLRPASVSYGELQEQLVRYWRFVDGGGWPAVPRGRTLSRGDAGGDGRGGRGAARAAAPVRGPPLRLDGAGSRETGSGGLELRIRKDEAHPGLTGWAFDAMLALKLPLLGSNQDSPDPESGVLPVTPRGRRAS